MEISAVRTLAHKSPTLITGEFYLNLKAFQLAHRIPNASLWCRHFYHLGAISLVFNSPTRGLAPPYYVVMGDGRRVAVSLLNLIVELCLGVKQLNEPLIKRKELVAFGRVVKSWNCTANSLQRRSHSREKDNDRTRFELQIRGAARHAQQEAFVIATI